MSRPRPRILAEIVDKKTYHSEQVLAAHGIWAVFYDNAPCNLRTLNQLQQHPGPKYKKVAFSNPGHAINLARKLNQQFRTDQFTVVLMQSGPVVYPDAHTP